MTTKTGFHGFILVFVAALVSWPLAAQEVTGNITGAVVDPSGAAVANATVTVTATSQGIVLRTLQTNEVGLYSATLLPVGTYSVTVEAAGFKRSTRDSIELNANAKYTADFQLEVGTVEQEVSVVASAVQVELQTAQMSGLISGTQVRELALNNRHFAQLVALQPGVSSNLSDQIYVGTTNPSGGNNIVGLAINGMRQSQNNWTVDGADNVDRGSNITIQQYPSIDAIEEIKIVRSAYSSEFGRAGGGQISVITKSGTKDLHGSVYEFWRNDKLNANNFFSNRTGAPCPAFRFNQYGLTAGGPAVKDKVFWFFNWESLRQRTPFTYVAGWIPGNNCDAVYVAHSRCSFPEAGPLGEDSWMANVRQFGHDLLKVAKLESEVKKNPQLYLDLSSAYAGPHAKLSKEYTASLNPDKTESAQSKVILENLNRIIDNETGTRLRRTPAGFRKRPFNIQDKRHSAEEVLSHIKILRCQF